MAVLHTKNIDRTRWQARPTLARALCLTVFVVPVAGSYLVTRLAAPLVGGLPLLGRLFCLGALAVLVGFAAERVFRRVLPLAALLRMTLLFPDHAPSRFKLARAAGQTSILEERARVHPDETVGEAATRILGLLTALSTHDRRTRGHSERVRVFTDVLAAELHLPAEARDRLRWAALLHDLGKIRVPSGVLNKPAQLAEDEWAMIRRHPDQGAELAGPLLTWLGEWGAAISEHHERFDGKGYPRGLAGHEIAQAGRIVAVADTFEVMTAVRSYKRPMSVAAARRELAHVAGTQLDPACVRAFLGASLPRVLWAVGPLALLVNLPVLRGVAEAGRVVEHAGAAAAGQAATVAVAATTAVVLSVPGVAPAMPAGNHAPRTHASTSAVATSHGRPPATSGHRTVRKAVAVGPDHVSDASFSTRKSTGGSTPTTHVVPASGTGSGASATPTPADTKPPATKPTPAPPVVVAVKLDKQVSLGSAASYAVLAGSTITNTGLSTISGAVGLSPGTAVTGFLASLIDVTLQTGNPVAAQAKTDLSDAYDEAAARDSTDTIPVELGGTTVTPGVYDSPAGTFGITGTVTLDAKGDPDAVFIFKAASTLITASGSKVRLINGAQAANVFWQVGSSATLGTYSTLRGTVLAHASITVTTGTTVEGRMLARTGAVTLDSDTIVRTPGGR
jgi:HD-GYP domain-containing protein (c-di-GMP phosphodiesterase class II)